MIVLCGLNLLLNTVETKTMIVLFFLLISSAAFGQVFIDDKSDFPKLLDLEPNTVLFIGRTIGDPVEFDSFRAEAEAILEGRVEVNPLITDLLSLSLANVRAKYTLEELLLHAKENEIPISNERNVNVVIRELIEYYTD